MYISKIYILRSNRMASNYRKRKLHQGFRPQILYITSSTQQRSVVPPASVPVVSDILTIIEVTAPDNYDKRNEPESIILEIIDNITKRISFDIIINDIFIIF